MSFSAPFADSEATKWGSKLTLLTQHSYVAGAGTSGCSLANLQVTTTKLTDIFTTMQGAATKNKITLGWRMGENNTCSGHGQPGVSDTFISALWAIDYMFEVAKRGGAGINFHNGETGMDGTVPFYYEPIKEQNGVVVQVQPEYYGMLLFTQAGTGAMVFTTVTTSAQDFTAWAIKANGFTSVVLNNRSASSDPPYIQTASGGNLSVYVPPRARRSSVSSRPILPAANSFSARAADRSAAWAVADLELCVPCKAGARRCGFAGMWSPFRRGVLDQGQQRSHVTRKRGDNVVPMRATSISLRVIQNHEGKQ